MQVPISGDRLLAIERAAVAAWPALETADIDGWLWRYSGGGSQRANSVSALAFQGGVAEGVAIAECVMTRADRRRGGAASRVMRVLEAWGAREGATIAALQAVAANEPAQGLYAKLAYARVGGYHYRVLDP